MQLQQSTSCIFNHFNNFIKHVAWLLFWEYDVKIIGCNLLQSGDSSAPLGQSGVLSHTVVRLMQTLWPGHCHCQLGHWKGGEGQSLSSLMSLQSLSPSQSQLRSTQFPLSQRKKEEGQVRGGQAWCSSLPSWQSGWPSHSHIDGMQLPSDWHWNSLSWWHIPGGLVAGI